jgi:outer membrane protein assembly factor BamE (lipoprotein component of BamABCDE complex)|tara:strand:+ start:84 stop:533 length:450 start_codon:yes stop_codon:yes gene_type:complete
MKKIIYLLLILLFIISCQRKEVIRTHGISYLEKREKLVFVNKTNKNDTIDIFGQPSTKGMTDENLWIYVERTITRGKMLRLGRNLLKKNNVLVLEFDKYGILKKKEFYNLQDMKKLTFEKNITENEMRKENFVYSFLSSIRQKMQQRKK